MTLPLSSISLLFGSSASSGGVDFSFLTAGQSSSSGTGAGVGSIKSALANAEKNEAKQREQVAKDPQVVKDLARYAKVVKNAKTMDDVLNDPVARKVFMTANGLKGSVDYVGLAKKALNSDPSDDRSPAAKLASINGTWYDTVQKWPVGLAGIGVLQVSDAVTEISQDYISEKRLDMLDAQLPGLGSAVLFKEIAPKLEDALDILGSPLGREVITTALNIPKQIAVQSVEAQMKAINTRMNPAKLTNPTFVNTIAERYLIMLNGGVGGVTA
jgi:Protein of unknown function (DUF1217)